MNNVQYLIASHCFAFVTVFSNVLLYYVRIDLICKRISLLKSLSKLLSSSSSNDDSQQTLNFICHLLSDLWNRSKISVKISLLQFFWLNILIFFIFFVISDDCDVDEEDDSEITSIEKEFSKIIETNWLNVIICLKRLIAMRKTFLLMIHFIDYNWTIYFIKWLWALFVDFAKLTQISNRLIIEVTKTFIWFEIKSSYLWSVFKNSLIW